MKNKIIIFFIFFLIFFALYQDFPLVAYFGEIARSPIVFLCPLLLIFIFSQKKILVNQSLRIFSYYIIYLWVISLIYLWFIKIDNSGINFLGENLIIKMMKMSIYPVVSLIFYWFFYSFFTNNKSSYEIVFRVFKWLQIFYFFYLILEIFFLKKDAVFLSFLHATDEKYWRIRLLTGEESWTGTIIILLIFFPIFLANFLNKDRKQKRNIYIYSFLIFFSYLFVSESKGFLFLLLISVSPLLLMMVMKNHRFKKVRKVLFPILLVCIILVGINFFTIVKEQFYASITFGTRLTSILSSLKVFIYNPFGVGWPGMVYYYPKEIQSIIDTGIVDKLNLFEIKEYTNSMQALSTKTDFLDSLMQGGIAFIVFYYMFFIKKYIILIKTNENIFLKIILLYLILAGIVYITYLIKYEVWFFLAFIDAYLNKNNGGETKENINSR